MLKKKSDYKFPEHLEFDSTLVEAINAYTKYMPQSTTMRNGCQQDVMLVSRPCVIVPSFLVISH